MCQRRRTDPRQLALPLYWPPDPTPYELCVVARTVQALSRWAGGPVSSSLVAGHIGRSERTARYYLRRLERARVVARPKGPRSGWMVTRGMVQ